MCVDLISFIVLYNSHYVYMYESCFFFVSRAHLFFSLAGGLHSSSTFSLYINTNMVKIILTPNGVKCVPFTLVFFKVRNSVRRNFFRYLLFFFFTICSSD